MLGPDECFEPRSVLGFADVERVEVDSDASHDIWHALRNRHRPGGGDVDRHR